MSDVSLPARSTAHSGDSDAPAQRAPSARRRWSVAAHAALPWCSIALLIALWAWATRNGGSFLPSPAQVVAAGADLQAEGILLPSLATSLARVGLGLGAGLVAAIALAALTCSSSLGYAIADKPVHMLRSIPFPALTPLLIILLGIGETMKVTLIAIGAFGLIYVNLRDAIRGIDPKLMELARAYGLTRMQTLRKVLLPGALPGLMTGLRFATVVAWIALASCETVNASTGLGYILSRAQQFSRTDQMVLCIAVYAVLGLLSEALVNLLSKAAMPWRR